MSSPEDDEPAASADDVTDPALQAEIANPAESNVPTGADAAPGDGGEALDPPAAPVTADASPPSPADAGDETGAEGVQGADAVPKDGAPADAGADADADADADDSAATPGQPDAEPAPAAEEGGLPVEAQTRPDAAAAEATPVESEERAAEEPAAEPEATDEVRQSVLDALREALGEGVVDAELRAGSDLWVRVRAEDWRQAAEVCRNQLGLTYFCFLSAIDWLPSPFGKSEDGEATTREEVRAAVSGAGPLQHGYAGGETRFQLLARVCSIARKVGVNLKADLDDAAPAADTWTGIYPGANWHEREAWEMFGIEFRGHPHLVKLYLPGDFEGFPLRKDFPLLAREVKPWPGIVDVEGMPGVADDPADDPLAAAGAEAEG